MPNFLAVSWAMASCVARDHLDLHTHLPRGRDGGLGIFPRRIEQGQHTEKLPLPFSLGARHAQRTKAARSEFVDRLVDGGLNLSGVGRQLQNHLRRALSHLERASVSGFDGGFGAFMHRIEWLEMHYLMSTRSNIARRSYVSL